jgi:hypothetical protein
VRAQTAPIRRRISFSPLPTARGELTPKETSLLSSPYKKQKPGQHKAGARAKAPGRMMNAVARRQQSGSNSDSIVIVRCAASPLLG